MRKELWSFEFLYKKSAMTRHECEKDMSFGRYFFTKKYRLSSAIFRLYHRFRHFFIYVVLFMPKLCEDGNKRQLTYYLRHYANHSVNRI